MKTIISLLLVTLSVMVMAKEDETRKAPNFTLKNTLGENIRLSEQIGNVVVLNFWATWCGPCRDEIAALETFHQKYKNLGLTVIGVIMNKDKRKSINFIDRVGVNYINVFDLEHDIVQKYQVDEIPSTFIIDRDGVIRYTYIDYKGVYKTTYEKEIRALLKE